MSPAQFDPEEILAVLSAAGVRFVLIGGFAAIAHGDVAATFDVDVVPDPDPENLKKLAIALRNLGAWIRTEGVEDGLPFDFTAKTLAASSMWNLVTRAGALDVTFEPSGTHGYADLRRAAIQIELGDATVTVASLADVIRSKEAAGREKDRLALPRLRRLLERIDSST